MLLVGFVLGVLVSTVFYVFIVRGLAKDLACLVAWNVTILRSLNGLLEDLSQTMRELNEALRTMEVDETDE